MNSEFKCYFTVVYAANSERERDNLWPALAQKAPMIQEPWLLAGDFNVTWNYGEMIKGGEIVPNDNNKMADFAGEAELSDMKFSGQLLTWCNNREGGERIYCKLDMTMVNENWLQKFPHVETIFESEVTSDMLQPLCTLDSRKEDLHLSSIMICGRSILSLCS